MEPWLTELLLSQQACWPLQFPPAAACHSCTRDAKATSSLYSRHSHMPAPADPYSSCLPLLHQGVQKQPHLSAVGAATSLPLQMSCQQLPATAASGRGGAHVCLQHPLEQLQCSHAIARAVLLLPLLQQLRCLQQCSSHLLMWQFGQLLMLAHCVRADRPRLMMRHCCMPLEGWRSWGRGCSQ